MDLVAVELAELGHGWGELATAPPADLAALETQWLPAAAGKTLLHGDINQSNLLIDHAGSCCWNRCLRWLFSAVISGVISAQGNPRRQPAFRSAGGGLDYREVGEVTAVKAPVPGQQPVGLQARVSTDEEVRDYALPGAAACAIAAPRLTGAVSTLPLQRAERRAESGHGSLGAFPSREEGAGLGPHDGAREHRANRKALTETIPRRRAEGGVGGEYVEEHAGVHSGDHGNSAGPRSSVMSSSVVPATRRIP